MALPEAGLNGEQGPGLQHGGRWSQDGRTDQVQPRTELCSPHPSASDGRAHVLSATRHRRGARPALRVQICAAMRGGGGCMATPSEVADGNQTCVKGWWWRLLFKRLGRETGTDLRREKLFSAFPRPGKEEPGAVAKEKTDKGTRTV